MRKYSVSKEDVKFFVNEEQRKVVAVIEGTELFATNFIRSNFPHCELDWEDPLRDMLHMPSRYVAVATCSENDIWDENIGRLIAYDRLKEKVDKSMFKRFQSFIDTMEKRTLTFISRTNTYGEKLTKNTEKRKDYIAGLVGEEE